MTAPTAREIAGQLRLTHTMVAAEPVARCQHPDVWCDACAGIELLEQWARTREAATWRAAAAMIYDKPSHVCGYDYGCSDCLRREFAAALAARGEET